MSKNRVDILIAAQDRASRTMNHVARNAVMMGNTIRTAAAGALAYLGGRALIGQIKESVALYTVQEQAERRLAQALHSTGGAAGFTADEMMRQAAALQEVTKYGDEAVIGAQALMATFTKVNGQVFTESIEMALDMSEALGQDLKSSVIQLGKALNDPVTGAAALRRVGVSLTAQQMEQIKVLTDQNRLYDAQRIILSELSTEFGGQAKAAAGGTGVFRQMANAVGDLREEFARGLMPMLTEAAQSITAWAKNHKQQVYEAAYVTGSYMLLAKDGFASFIEYLQTDFVGGIGFAMNAMVRLGDAAFYSLELRATEAVQNIVEKVTGVGNFQRGFVRGFMNSVQGKPYMAGISTKDPDELIAQKWETTLAEIRKNMPEQMALGMDEAYEKHLQRMSQMGQRPEYAGIGKFSGAGMVDDLDSPAAKGGKAGSNVMESLFLAGPAGTPMQQYQKETARNTMQTNMLIKRNNALLEQFVRMAGGRLAGDIVTLR